MASDDFILVVEELLNEIRPLKEEFEMMSDEHRSDNQEFRKAQLDAIKERMQEIDNLVSQLDSIVEAHSGGKRKTKRRRNKKKSKTRKKGRRCKEAGLILKRVKDAVGRLLKTRDDIDKAKTDKTLVADTRSVIMDYLKKAPGSMKKKQKKLGRL